VDADGRKIDGFYFELTGGGPNVGYAFVRAAVQDNSLLANLKALLDANGKAAVPIADLQQRPYEDSKGRLAQGMRSVLVKASTQ
jgi:hypothetical protein